ncbi:MAG: right-handed parallel beta-helix repeat-containing protein [Planctomycetes bacterium]|nr:right-handed parallel beta-helix repeat-containing protein [Planctomycetota bacterium]
MRKLPFSLALTLLTGLAAAQTALTGNVYDGAGGPLLSGNVYYATGHLTVPTGQTLTIQPGAILKFGIHVFYVNGTLRCQGTAAQPCYLTSLHDDSVGGDTNGNGSGTALAAGQWYGMEFAPGSDASVLTHTKIRAIGWGNWCVRLYSSASLVDCAISDASYGGIEVSASALPTVTRCDLQRVHGVPAVRGLSYAGAAGFLDTTASNCPGGAYMAVDTPSVTGNLTLGPRNGIGSVLVYRGHTSVAAGAVLTLQAGLVLKASSPLAFYVAGTLVTNGSVANRVVFTSIHDDSAGGDTNQNGAATARAASQWYGLEFNPGSSSSALAYADVRCTGWGNWSCATINGSTPQFTDCRFSDGGYGGVQLGAGGRPALTRCHFEGIQSVAAIRGVPLDAVPDFLDNTIANCAVNYLQIDHGTLGASTTIQRANCPNGVLVYASHLTIPLATSLTLGAGIALKAASPLAIYVNGTLVANGTAGQRVVFTSIHDDSVGGDTNGNGSNTALAPSQWYGMDFGAESDQSQLTFADLRGCGWGNWACANLGSSAAGFTSCRFTDAGYGGILVDSNSRPVMQACEFARVNGQPAMRGFTLDALAGLDSNTAADCPGGNYTRVDHGTPQASCSVRPENLIGRVLVYTVHLTAPSGLTLTLDPGVILKAASPLVFYVRGNLVVHGPVVFTSMHDDLHGGDTNGNGNASAAATSQWYGIQILAGAAVAMELGLVRCTGWGNFPALESQSGLVSLRRCRVELGGYGAFDLGDAAVAEDLVAFANVGHGFILRGGGFALRRATSAYNTGAGVRRETGWTGVVRSTIAHGNGGGGFVNFAANQISWSDGPGIVGGSGNLNADPLFVSAGAGDLRLSPLSPCVEAGDPLDAPTGLDGIGFPRFLDGNVDGSQRVDMGAYEFDNLILLVSGSSSPGGTLQVASIASPQLPIVVLTLGLPFDAGLPVLNLGSLFVDPTGPFDAIVWPANGSAPITIPSSLVGPIPFAFQLIGLGNPFPRGNTSNPYHFTIQ